MTKLGKLYNATRMTAFGHTRCRHPYAAYAAFVTGLHQETRLLGQQTTRNFVQLDVRRRLNDTILRRFVGFVRRWWRRA